MSIYSIGPINEKVRFIREEKEYLITLKSKSFLDVLLFARCLFQSLLL